MNNRKSLYLSLSFLTGILITLGLKDLYPDLERRYRQHRQRQRLQRSVKPSNRHVDLEDHTAKEYQKNRNEDIKEGIEGCIGNTPLFRLKALSEATGCEILAKAEFLNGAGNSPKDRVALSIIKSAEEEGLLTPNSGDMIYEGTVGSTGISLAAICRARGYRAHICMPSDQSHEKSALLLRLGAIVERVPPAPIVDPSHFVNLARRRAQEHTSSPTKPGRGLFADQFENPANWRAHFETTGPEIFVQTGGELDAFVAGAGTGGTVSGVAMFLKGKMKELGEKGRDVKIVIADPTGSGLYSLVKHSVLFAPQHAEGTRRRAQVDSIVEGIGLTRLVGNFEVGRDYIDDAVRVTDAQAKAMGRWLVEREGVFVGSSSAVNCFAAAKVALGIVKEKGRGRGRVVTVLCDPGTRHMSRFWAQDEAGAVGGETGITLEDVLNAE
ncbi:cysteine synthase [Aulographum hederae CBS 113979]|uniref:Cysteine synthase 2 n=1 Tax=Aulographum hederae CBS 113979 TaxID=1176131 RepID=A0A6G1HFB4_9PEZI|nr:cysteine synthase [Aulographum hederae CBS 113979]